MSSGLRSSRLTCMHLAADSGTRSSSSSSYLFVESAARQEKEEWSQVSKVSSLGDVRILRAQTSYVCDSVHSVRTRLRPTRFFVNTMTRKRRSLAQAKRWNHLIERRFGNTYTVWMKHDITIFCIHTSISSFYCMHWTPYAGAGLTSRLERKYQLM